MCKKHAFEQEHYLSFVHSMFLSSIHATQLYSFLTENYLFSKPRWLDIKSRVFIKNGRKMWHFLDASMHLYKRVCPLVRSLVRSLVGWSIRQSIRNTFVLYSRECLIPASELKGREKEKGKLRRAGKEVTRGQGWGRGRGQAYTEYKEDKGEASDGRVSDLVFFFSRKKKKKNKKNVCSIKQQQ